MRPAELGRRCLEGLGWLVAVQPGAVGGSLGTREEAMALAGEGRRCLGPRREPGGGRSHWILDVWNEGAGGRNSLCALGFDLDF